MTDRFGIAMCVAAVLATASCSKEDEAGAPVDPATRLVEGLPPEAFHGAGSPVPPLPGTPGGAVSGPAGIAGPPGAPPGAVPPPATALPEATPPPMEDGAAASRGPALPPAAGIAALPGTRWVQVDAGARFRELHFTPTFLVLTTQAGQMVTLVADYSSSHPLCGGYPSCLMTVDGQANAVPFFFGQQDGVLFLAECRIAGQLDAEGNPLNFPALVEEHREALVYSSPRAVCWNPREVPFRMEPM